MARVTAAAEKTTSATDKLREAQIKEQAAMQASAAKFHKNRVEQEKASKAYVVTTRSVAGLTEKLKQVRQKRAAIDEKDVVNIGKYNREIDYLQAKLRRLNRVGLATDTKPVKPGAAAMAAKSAQSGSMSALLGRSNVVAALGFAASAIFVQSLRLGLRQGADRAILGNAYGSDGDNVMRLIQKNQASLGQNAMQDSRSLMDAGYGSGDAVGILQQLGDVANGDDSRRSALVSAMSAVRKEGKLTAESLANLESAGFRPLVEINRATGESFDSIYTRLAQGKISFSELETALRNATAAGGKFHGNLERIMATPTAKIDRISNSFMRLVGNFGENFVNNIDKAASAMTGVFTAVQKVDKGLKDIIGQRAHDFFGGLFKVASQINPLGQVANAMNAMTSDPGKPKAEDIRGRNPMMAALQESDQLLRERQQEKAAKAAEDAAAAEAKRTEQINAVSGGGSRNYTINIGKMIETINNQFAGGEQQAAAESMRKSLEEQLIRVFGSITTAGR